MHIYNAFASVSLPKVEPGIQIFTYNFYGFDLTSACCWEGGRFESLKAFLQLI